MKKSTIKPFWTTFWVLVLLISAGRLLWPLASPQFGLPTNRPVSSSLLATKMNKGTKSPKPQLPLITCRKFLVGEEHEGDGFGLYSYLLFGSPPTTPARTDLYIAVTKEYLALPELLQFPGTSKSQLNVTMMPLVAVSSSGMDDPAKVLPEYNYARAQVLLRTIPRATLTDGPYLVSTEKPLTDAGTITDHYLFQDLSSVRPEIVVLWMHEFINQSAQPDFWKARNGPQTALRLRNAIATLAAGVDPTTKSVGQWQTILASLLFWKQKA